MIAGGAPELRRRAPPGAAPTRKAAPGQPWSHQETIALIDAYEERWYALKRGHLKAEQWEEVAAAVAARCGLVDSPKTGTQCRHKVEKLRKRYRADRIRPSPSPWPYFDRMDRMERGPLPISTRTPGAGDSSEDEEEDEEEDDDNADEEKVGSNIRSINGILREGNWGSRNPMPQKRRAFEVENEEEEDDEEEDDGDDDGDDDDQEEGGGRGSLSQLAAVVRRFGDGMVRMEKRRMEMMREAERDWMQMETKRAEMVMESQRSLVEKIASTFSSLKKAGDDG